MYKLSNHPISLSYVKRIKDSIISYQNQYTTYEMNRQAALHNKTLIKREWSKIFLYRLKIRFLHQMTKLFDLLILINHNKGNTTYNYNYSTI